MEDCSTNKLVESRLIRWYVQISDKENLGQVLGHTRGEGQLNGAIDLEGKWEICPMLFVKTNLSRRYTYYDIKKETQTFW